MVIRFAPSVDEVRQLPTAIDSEVPERFIDENGHMSLPHYVSAAALALWERQRVLGLDALLASGISNFAAEQHIQYLSELRRGERFTGHTRFLARSAKAMHSVSFIVDSQRDRLSCVVQSVNVFVSMESRRGVDIPEQLAAAIDFEIADSDALSWTPSLCRELWRQPMA
jgi:acyl-CoA thioester hydrolase